MKESSFVTPGSELPHDCIMNWWWGLFVLVCACAHHACKLICFVVVVMNSCLHYTVVITACGDRRALATQSDHQMRPSGAERESHVFGKAKVAFRANLSAQGVGARFRNASGGRTEHPQTIKLERCLPTESRIIVLGTVGRVPQSQG